MDSTVNFRGDNISQIGSKNLKMIFLRGLISQISEPNWRARSWMLLHEAIIMEALTTDSIIRGFHVYGDMLVAL